MKLEKDFWELACAAFSERIGLHFPPGRVGELKRALLPAAAELGLRDAEACAAELLAGRLDDARLEIVASHLTIGETYFMRGDETFAALRAEVLPGLIAASRRDGRHALRIWSAGCCTGEEAYSLAILVRELLPDLASWHVDILATDVNPRFLAKAEAGTYGEWSFRGTPEGFRTRYFRPAGDGRFALDDGVRAMVRFAQMNLVDGKAWAGLVPPAAFDLILCRNVLMYFTPAQAARVVAGFHRALRREGWAVVAPCEISQPLFSRFEPVAFEGTIFYRKPEANAGRPRAEPAAAAAAAKLPTHRERASIGDRTQPPSLSPLPSPPSSPSSSPADGTPLSKPIRDMEATAADPGSLEHRARALADQGRLDEALAWCDRWVAADKLAAAAHYLRAVVLMEGGRWEEARESLQRCLYLEPEDAVASFALGNLERRLGRPEAARRQYHHILAVLQRRRSNASLAHDEGITVAQLDRVVRNLLQKGRDA